MNANFLLIDPGESCHRRAPPFRPEERKGLNFFPFLGGGGDQQLGSHDCPLPAPSMNPDFNHDLGSSL
jgi:hypothetical protein